jgi:acetyl esterase
VKSLAAKAYAFAFEGGISAFATAARALPWADPSRHDVAVEEDVRYGPLDAHRLDVWAPRTTSKPPPIAVYIHGGGFTLFSKESHWLMGLVFARRGFLTYNIEYRLAPQHPFPAALEDVARAWRFVLDDAKRRGADLSSIVVAGESAGANLTLGLAVSACIRRSEPWCAEIFDAGVVPTAIMPACGILQVSDPDRFQRAGHADGFIAARIQAVSRHYLGGCTLADPAHKALCDPLLVLEQTERVDRPLPAMFIPVGALDWIREDSLRLERAARRLGAKAEAKVYPGGVHAFHTVAVSERARTCWKDSFRFLRDVLPADAFKTFEL